MNILPDNKKYIFFAVAFLAGGTIGWQIGFAQGEKRINAELAQKIEKAKQLFPATAEVRSLSGTVKDIKGNTIRIETPSSPNPFEEWPVIREIIVTEKTKIVRAEVKDQTSPAPPLLDLIQPFRETNISLQDIKAGGRIFVETDENIKIKTRFEAVRILLIK